MLRIALLLTLLIPIIGLSQGQSLFFIAASPQKTLPDGHDPRIPENIYYHLLDGGVFSISRNNLKEEFSILPDSNFVINKIIHYPKEGLITINSIRKIWTDGKTKKHNLLLINYKNGLNCYRLFSNDFLGRSYKELIKIENDLFFEMGVSVKQGLSSFSTRGEILRQNIYTRGVDDLIRNGTHSIGNNFIGRGPLIYNPNNKSITWVRPKHLNFEHPFEIKCPIEFEGNVPSNKIIYVDVPLISEDFIFVNTKYLNLKIPKQGSSKFAVLSRKSNSWSNLDIQGDASSLILHKGGWVSYSTANEKGGTPGKKHRTTFEKRFKGISYDMWFSEYRKGHPGELNLIHLESGNTIRWNTLYHGDLQADSEILIVSDYEVIYRVHDEIRKRSIYNCSEVGPPSVIVKDYRVPFIHWGFYSTKPLAAITNIDVD